MQPYAVVLAPLLFWWDWGQMNRDNPSQGFLYSRTLKVGATKVKFDPSICCLRTVLVPLCVQTVKRFVCVFAEVRFLRASLLLPQKMLFSF